MTTSPVADLKVEQAHLRVYDPDGGESVGQLVRYLAALDAVSVLVIDEVLGKSFADYPVRPAVDPLLSSARESQFTGYSTLTNPSSGLMIGPSVPPAGRRFGIVSEAGRIRAPCGPHDVVWLVPHKVSFDSFDMIAGLATAASAAVAVAAFPPAWGVTVLVAVGWIITNPDKVHEWRTMAGAIERTKAENAAGTAEARLRAAEAEKALTLMGSDPERIRRRLYSPMALNAGSRLDRRLRLCADRHGCRATSST